MAQDYEVREEFRSHSLSQLMDDQVLCFQGVGEIQAELLKQYFAIATVRDLANWTPFLWSLEIQELALHGGDLARTKIRSIAQESRPTFQVRERGLDLTPEQLMHASVSDLEGLTPAQDLALYDIFRITSIAQLAHNRIMLEARVIQYLEGQSHAADEAEPGPEGVDTVLGRPKAAIAASGAQRVTETRTAGRDERLHAMESETRDHVQERLTAVRERARGRAAAPGSPAGRAGAIAATAAAGVGTRRLENLRATRGSAQAAAGGDRVTAVASRRTTVASGVGHERGALDESRSLRRAGAGAERASGVLASRTAAGGPAAGPGVSSRAASVLAARSGSPGGARFGGGGGGSGSASYAGRTGGGGGGGGSGAAAVRTATTAAPAAAATATVAAGAAVTPPPAAATLRTAPSRGAPPILLAAIAGLVVLGVILFFILRSGSSTAPGGAGTATQTAQQSGAGSAGTATQPGAAGTTTQAGAKPGAPGTATQPGTATGAAQPGAKPGTAGSAAVPGQTTAQTAAGAPGAAKTIHTVREGQSLWRISKRYYTLGSKWPAIYKENQEQIKIPDLIYPKQRFRIPPKP